jgi:hypothetical protein
VDKYFPASLLDQCYAPLPPYHMGDHEVAALQAHADAAKAAWYRQYARWDEDPESVPPNLRADIIPSPRQIPGLTVYVPPDPDHRYVIGADPAEGNPQSDESAAVVLDINANEQVATLGLRCDPELFATHLVKLATLYFDAQILVERNNHGHAVLQALWNTRAPSTASLVYGPDHERGWLTTGASKAQAFAHTVASLRDRALTIRDEITYWQLASIDGGTMRAPQGQHDDRAMACILALAALEFCGAGSTGESAAIPPEPLWPPTPGGW